MVHVKLTIVAIRCCLMAGDFPMTENLTYAYPFDPTGLQATNLIEGERQTISPPNYTDFYFLIPLAAPYFRDSLIVTHHPSGQQLSEGVDYSCTHRFHDASLAVGKSIYGSITFFDKTLSGIIELSYQTIGGAWTLATEQIEEILANSIANPRRTTWEQITELPFQFPVIDHEWNLDDLVGMTEVVEALDGIRQALLATGDSDTALGAHILDVSNPHQVTKTQVGLGNVQNYLIASQSQAQVGTSNTTYMTPLRTTELIAAGVGADLAAHIADHNNPHAVTASQINAYTIPQIDALLLTKSDLDADKNPGEVDFGHNKLMTDRLEPGMIVEWVNVAQGSTEVTAVQAMLGDLQEDYQEFLTASAYGANNRNAVVGELTGWSWNNTVGGIQRVAAPDSLASLRESDHYTDYTFEVELSSTDVAAKSLGVVAAFVRKNGVDHQITVLRTPGGLVLDSQGLGLPGGNIYKLFSVGYNLLQNDAIDLGSTNTGLIWGDGIPNVNRGTAGAFVEAGHGWSVNGVVRIRVVRTGNILTIKTSQFNATDVNAGATVTIDLTSRPELAPFLGPTAWGICSFKQANGRFKVISRPDYYQPYVDFSQDVNGNDTSTMNRYNGNTWVTQPMTIANSFIKPGRIYYSDHNGAIYFARRNGTLRPMYIEAFTRNDTTVLTA